MTKIYAIVLLSAIAAVAAPAGAQQASDAAKTPPAAKTQNSTATSPAAAESDDAAAAAAMIAKANAAAAKATTPASTKATDTASMAKKAREAGWRPEADKGETVYCRDDPTIGSRFPTRRCVHQNQLQDILDQAQYDKDLLQRGSCNGGSCSPTK